MKGKIFNPEMTSPLIDREVLRLKFISFIYMRYPAKCKNLLAAWPLFDALTSEAVLSLNNVIFSSNVDCLDDLQIQGTALGYGELLGELISWAKNINLPYPWVVAAGLWAFRTMQADESASFKTNNLNVRLGMAFALARGRISALPAVHAPVTNQAGVFGVILPRFRPTQQSEVAYRAECKSILDDYILREHRAHRERGLSRPSSAPSEDEHLEWLAMKLVEGVAAPTIARRATNGFSRQTVDKSLKVIAERIGVNLERS